MKRPSLREQVRTLKAQLETQRLTFEQAREFYHAEQERLLKQHEQDQEVITGLYRERFGIQKQEA